jgi:hypothetical protein
MNKEEIIKYLSNYYIINNKSPIINENHPFTFSNIKKIFKTWNNALISANIPLNRNEKIYVKCKLCKKEITKEFKEIKKSINDFCSHSCSAIYNNKGRIMSEETKEKIRKKLQKIRYTKCKICNIEFRYFKRKNMTCNERCLSLLKKRNNLKKKGIILEF